MFTQRCIFHISLLDWGKYTYLSHLFLSPVWLTSPYGEWYFITSSCVEEFENKPSNMQSYPNSRSRTFLPKRPYMNILSFIITLEILCTPQIRMRKVKIIGNTDTCIYLFLWYLVICLKRLDQNKLIIWYFIYSFLIWNMML